MEIPSEQVTVTSITISVMAQSTSLSPERREIIEYLRREKLASPVDMREDLDRSSDSIRMMLTRMRRDGQVVRPLRGYYTVPEVADELGLPFEDEDAQEESPAPEGVVENPLSITQSGQLSLGMEEGRRRKGIAYLAKVVADKRDREESERTVLKAKSHPWWPMRTDVWARIRWWIAEKLARMIVRLIPREELPNKDSIYGNN